MRIVTGGAPVVAIVLCALATRGLADDLEPSTEQVSERTRGFIAMWDALRDRVAGMRVRVDESLVSSGEFDGARAWWVRSGLAIEGGLPLSDQISVGIAPSFAWERLFLSGSDQFVVSQNGREARFTDFYDSGLRIGAKIQTTEELGIEFVTGFSARHERGADYADATQGGGSIAVDYRRGDWLRLRLGLGIGTDLEDGKLRFSPVYRVQIRPTPRLTLEARGLGGSVDWRLAPGTNVALEGRLDGTQYALERSGLPPIGGGDATLQRRQGRLSLELRHRLNERVRLRGGLGLVLDEELVVFDEDGIDVDTRRERDPSLTLQLGLELRL